MLLEKDVAHSEQQTPKEQALVTVTGEQGEQA